LFGQIYHQISLLCQRYISVVLVRRMSVIHRWSSCHRFICETILRFFPQCWYEQKGHRPIRQSPS
jgi:hypothetical protein